MPTNIPTFRAILMENIDDEILKNQQKINELNIKIVDKYSDILQTTQEITGITKQIIEDSKEILDGTQEVLDLSSKILKI